MAGETFEQKPLAKDTYDYGKQSEQMMVKSLVQGSNSSKLPVVRFEPGSRVRLHWINGSDKY